MSFHSTSNNASDPDTSQHGGGGKMALLMALCCLAPLAAIIAVTVFGVPFSGLLTFALVALCPLMMVFMMAGGHGHDSTGQR
jgi:hypothetical protein